MRPLSPLGLVASLLWTVGLVSASTKLQVILKTSPAYAGLNDFQKSCGVSDAHAVARGSRCDDMACFCASPQTMSDDTDQCMLTKEGVYNVKGIYSTDTYNGVMTFFANECGTFEVQLKVCKGEGRRRNWLTDRRAGGGVAGHHVQDVPDADQLWVRGEGDGRCGFR